jgi:hypothetical protein
LAKNSYPLLFTKYLNFDFPMPNAEADTFAFPLALANYDNVLNDGFASLEMNPDYFEDIRTDMKNQQDRQNLERDLRSLPPEVRFHENRGSDIPAASFKPKPGTGKLIDGTNTDPNIIAPKKRWAGFPGVD